MPHVSYNQIHSKFEHFNRKYDFQSESQKPYLNNSQSSSHSHTRNIYNSNRNNQHLQIHVTIAKVKYLLKVYQESELEQVVREFLQQNDLKSKLFNPILKMVKEKITQKISKNAALVQDNENQGSEKGKIQENEFYHPQHKKTQQSPEQRWRGERYEGESGRSDYLAEQRSPTFTQRHSPINRADISTASIPPVVQFENSSNPYIQRLTPPRIREYSSVSKSMSRSASPKHPENRYEQLISEYYNQAVQQFDEEVDQPRNSVRKSENIKKKQEHQGPFETDQTPPGLSKQMRNNKGVFLSKLKSQISSSVHRKKSISNEQSEDQESQQVTNCKNLYENWKGKEKGKVRLEGERDNSKVKNFKAPSTSHSKVKKERQKAAVEVSVPRNKTPKKRFSLNKTDKRSKMDQKENIGSNLNEDSSVMADLDSDYFYQQGLKFEQQKQKHIAEKFHQIYPFTTRGLDASKTFNSKGGRDSINSRSKSNSRFTNGFSSRYSTLQPHEKQAFHSRLSKERNLKDMRKLKIEVQNQHSKLQAYDRTPTGKTQQKIMQINLSHIPGISQKQKETLVARNIQIKQKVAQQNRSIDKELGKMVRGGKVEKHYGIRRKSKSPFRKTTVF